MENANISASRILGFFKLTYRRLRLVKINRNLLVYLVFFVISIGFWCLQTLKEQTTQVLDFTYEITGVPKNVVFTSELPQYIKVTAEGRGFDFLDHISRNNNHIVIPYDVFQRKKGKAITDATYIRRQVQKLLGAAIEVKTCSPGVLMTYYSTGKKKRVPVLFGGKVQVGMQHVLGHINIKPDSVDIYAPQGLYDNVECVYTDNPFFRHVEDTIDTRIAIRKIHGVKIIPDSVRVQICVDLFTEKKISVPIYCENCPSNKVVRTFPIKADVTFHVSTNMYNRVTEKDFLIVIDYNDIINNPARCPVQLRNYPREVTHINVTPEAVEYVIEQAD